MPSPTQIQRFNLATNAIAISTMYNCSKQCRLLLPPSSPQLGLTLPETAAYHHAHMVGPHQYCFVIVQSINAPVETVWLVVLSFRASIFVNPQSALPCWNSSSEYCTWSNVTGDSRRHVSSLDLTGLNLSSTLSDNGDGGLERR